MELNDFLFVFDLFTTREIQKLETDRMKLTNTYPNKHSGSTSFTFSTNDDFVMVISVSLSKIHHVFSFWLGLDLVDKNGHNILTNHSYPFKNYLEEIESIAIFLQQKKIETERCIQKNWNRKKLCA